MDNDIEIEEPILRRECVQWPKTEPIPRTIEEALALGWEITDEHATVSADELTMEGTANLSKTIDLLELYLTIPFTAMRPGSHSIRRPKLKYPISPAPTISAKR